MSEHTEHTEHTGLHTETATGRHPVNVAHLVMGVAFLGVVVVWALVTAGGVGGDDLRWLLPVPWIAAGVAGVLAAVLPARSRRS